MHGPSSSVPAPSMIDSNNAHHHHHHHPYGPNQLYHHHSISQQQQQQAPSSQSGAPQSQPAPLVRLYPAGTPGNVSHPYAQAPYQSAPPPQTAFVQPGQIFFAYTTRTHSSHSLGSLPSGSFVMPNPAQTSGNVQTYPAFDNGVAYNNYGATPAGNTGGKGNPNNNNGTAVQYATNHMSALTLQSQHDEYQTRLINSQQARFNHSNGPITANNQQQRNFLGRPLVQSPNGSTGTPRMAVYSASHHQYRQSRPFTSSTTDKQSTSMENDPKSLTSTTHATMNMAMNASSDPISLAGPAQGTDHRAFLPCSFTFLLVQSDRTMSPRVTRTYTTSIRRRVDQVLLRSSLRATADDPATTH